MPITNNSTTITPEGNELNESRFDALYARLVDNTENREIYTHQIANAQLSVLLKVCEWLRNEDDDDPLSEMWGITE